MLTGFPRTRWPRLRFSESYAVRISVKISRICEFRVIMGIMTGLLGCCSSSTLGSRANDYVKTLATLGFWLHHSPCSLGCWTNNTLAARSSSPKYECGSTRLADTLQSTNLTKGALVTPSFLRLTFLPHRRQIQLCTLYKTRIANYSIFRSTMAICLFNMAS